MCLINNAKIQRFRVNVGRNEQQLLGMSRKQWQIAGSTTVLRVLEFGGDLSCGVVRYGP